MVCRGSVFPTRSRGVCMSASQLAGPRASRVCTTTGGKPTAGMTAPRSPIFLDDRFTFALRNATVVSVQSWPRHLGDSHPAAVHNVT